MKSGFLKKRSGAIIVTAAVIVLSTIFGVNRSLGREMSIVSDLFYDGVMSTQGYKQPSIKSQLEVRCNAALTLNTVANAYSELGDLTADLRNAENTLSNLLSEKVAPEKLFRANTALESAFDSLCNRLSDMPLTSREEEAVLTAQNRMEGAGRVISSCGYNEAVREFTRSTLSVFPTNLLQNICFTPAPGLFE